MNRRLLLCLFVAVFAAASFHVSPAAGQRSRPPERQVPDGFEDPPGRTRPDAAPEAGVRDARGREFREESEDGWPGGMQDRAGPPDAARLVPGFRPPPRWWLGVYAYNTPGGVFVTRVIPNSPAARAGLEPRDRIVTVEGYQVGYVGRRLYALGPELQLRAGRGGEVLLLVQDWRNGELTNIGVRLSSPRAEWPDRARPRGRFEDQEQPQ